MDTLLAATASVLLATAAAAGLLRRWSDAVAGASLGFAALLLLAADLPDATALVVVGAGAVVPLVAPVAALAVVGRGRTTLAALIAGVAAGPVRVITYDPFRDPACPRDCLPNPVALTSLGTTGRLLLDGASLLSALALTAAVRGARPALVCALVPAAAWLALPRLHQPHLAVELAAVSVLVVVGRRSATSLRQRAQLVDLLHALAGASDVERTLRAAVGDPGLTVDFRLDDGSFCSPHGGGARTQAPGQVTTGIRAGRSVVAQVHHRAGAIPVSALADALTGAARIAFDNGRLGAVQAAQARLLEASGHRVRRRAEAGRRRLERDLHDGAQPHLLALGLSLQSALRSPARDDASRMHYEDALASTRWALGEIREIGHGLHPVGTRLLDLSAHLAAFRDPAGAPLVVLASPPGAFPESTLRAIDLVLGHLGLESADPLQVVVHRSSAGLSMTVRSEPAVPMIVPEHLTQAVEALGGALCVGRVLPGARTQVVEATLPVVPLAAALAPGERWGALP